MADGKAHFDFMVAANEGVAPPPVGPYHDPASFNHKFATVKGGHRYHYVEEGNPSGTPILMVHGFPDLWYGWRFQIKHLASKGFRVIAVDTLGYGQTDAPDELHHYSYKNICGHLASLLDVLNIPKVIVIGHDWGGAAVWRFADYHPERVHAVISVCTPLMPLMDTYIPLEDIAEQAPHFAYQKFFADPDTTALFNADIRAMMTLTYTHSGVHPQELDYYTQEFSRHGFLGPLNYYRTRKINYEDELALPRNVKRPHPSMLIVATEDPVLHPSLSENMGKHFENIFERVFVTAGHFAMNQNPYAVNEAIDRFLAKILPNGPKAKL
ncbi:hypothetical protein BGW41_007222 [Actinomortierella wolfii]|nr:hypothetical protein BGW41_007222 [Actinomortierella wolfii]